MLNISISPNCYNRTAADQGTVYVSLLQCDTCPGSHWSVRLTLETAWRAASCVLPCRSTEAGQAGGLGMPGRGGHSCLSGCSKENDSSPLGEKAPRLPHAWVMKLWERTSIPHLVTHTVGYRGRLVRPGSWEQRRCTDDPEISEANRVAQTSNSFYQRLIHESSSKEQTLDLKKIIKIPRVGF